MWKTANAVYNGYLAIHLPDGVPRHTNLSVLPNNIRKYLDGPRLTGSNQVMEWVPLFEQMYRDLKAPSTGASLSELGDGQISNLAGYTEGTLAPPTVEFLQGMKSPPKDLIRQAQLYYSSPDKAVEAPSVGGSRQKASVAVTPTKLMSPQKLFGNDAAGASRFFSDALEQHLHRFLVNEDVLDSDDVSAIEPEVFQRVHASYVAERKQAPPGSVNLPARSLKDITEQCIYIIETLSKGANHLVGAHLSDDAGAEVVEIDDGPDEEKDMAVEEDKALDGTGEKPSDAARLHAPQSDADDKAADIYSDAEAPTTSAKNLYRGADARARCLPPCPPPWAR